jgi:aarF domain-containing kinase
MSDRASALAQLARGALGVALSAAATRGPLASKEMKAVAEMVLTRGVARRAARERASSRAAQETRDSARPIASASRHPSAAYAPAASLTDATDAKVERADDALMPRMAPASTSASAETDSRDATSKTKVRRREVAVPSSPLARVMGFGQLAAGLAAGTVAESARRAWRGAGGQTTGDVEKSSRRSSSPNSTRGEDPTQTSTSSSFSSSEDRVGSETLLCSPATVFF